MHVLDGESLPFNITDPQLQKWLFHDLRRLSNIRIMEKRESVASTPIAVSIISHLLNYDAGC